MAIRRRKVFHVPCDHFNSSKGRFHWDLEGLDDLKEEVVSLLLVGSARISAKNNGIKMISKGPFMLATEMRHILVTTIDSIDVIKDASYLESFIEEFIKCVLITDKDIFFYIVIVVEVCLIYMSAAYSGGFL